MMSQITIWINSANHPGQLRDIYFSEPPKSLDDASERIPGGVYTTFRTFNHDQALLLHQHIARLSDSARRLDKPIVVDETQVRQCIRAAISKFPADSRIRLTIDLTTHPGDLYLALEELHIPSTEAYHMGVCVYSFRLRRENPLAKQTAFITEADSVRQQLPKDVFEGLMVDEDGFILEGLSSNFFAVKQGCIWTASEGVLHGVTRSLVLAAAMRAGITVVERSVLIQNISEYDECFLSSSSRSIVPVTKVDDRVIGSGHPGPVTRQVMQVFWQEVQDRLEKI